MERLNIIHNYLEKEKIDIGQSSGLDISVFDDSILIKGSKYDLVELSEMILSVALSEENSDHLHIDDLTLVREDSTVGELVIEKED